MKPLLSLNYSSAAAPEWRPMHFKVTSGSRLSPQGKCRWPDVGNFQRVAARSASAQHGRRGSSDLKRPLLVGFGLGQKPWFSRTSPVLMSYLMQSKQAEM